MILSASRRTDIPCYYADWFMNRIRAGYVMTRNPMNYNQIRRVDLSPGNIDCIVFWTKDPQNLLPHLSVLDEIGYKYYFQFTLTPYGNDIEKNLRDKCEIEETFMRLSETIGKTKLIWRYDPIIINDTLTVDYHKREFERMYAKLSLYTDKIFISYVDMYAKIKSDLIKPIRSEDIAELNEFIKSVTHGEVRSCCCTDGFPSAACIDKTLIESIINKPLPDLKRDKNQRTGCGCCESVDIGVYNTCPNGCVYCYANYSAKSVNTNFARHDIDNEFMI